MYNFQAESKAGYSLLTPPRHSEDIVIFAPGMACNMYGHPYEDQPQGIVADMTEDLSNDYNMLFVDVNRFAGNCSGLYAGEPIQTQAQQLSSAYNSAFNGEQLKGRVLCIGQSLGSLAIALFACRESLGNNAHAIFVAPPTSEGQECTDSLIAMFSSNPKTAIDTEGNGVLQFGKDQMMSVNGDYWKSIEENSLRQHSDSLRARFASTIGLYATGDKYFRESGDYLSRHTAVVPIPIEGASHAFKTPQMRSQARDAVYSTYTTLLRAVS
jgi:hypothetical protein